MHVRPLALRKGVKNDLLGFEGGWAQTGVVETWALDSLTMLGTLQLPEVRHCLPVPLDRLLPPPHPSSTKLVSRFHARSLTVGVTLTVARAQKHRVGYGLISSPSKSVSHSTTHGPKPIRLQTRHPTHIGERALDEN